MFFVFIPEIFRNSTLPESTYLCVVTLLLVSIFWLYFFMKLRREALDQVNLTLTTYQNREELEQPTAERRYRYQPYFRLFRINGPSERMNHTLYNVIQTILAEREGLTFVGPNGDNDEYLRRDDLDGIILRNRPRAEAEITLS